jgi:hypothetical protein
VPQTGQYTFDEGYTDGEYREKDGANREAEPLIIQMPIKIAIKIGLSLKE